MTPITISARKNMLKILCLSLNGRRVKIPGDLNQIRPCANEKTPYPNSFSLDQPDSLLSFRQVRDSSRPNWKPPTAIQGRADNCDSRIEGSAIARKYCHSERDISPQRASPTARLQGYGGQLPRNALAVTVKLLMKSRLVVTNLSFDE